MKQTALITGASKRIGKAISEHLASNGWNIIIHYNSSGAAAKKLESELHRQFPDQKYTTVKADLSKENEVESLIPGVFTEFGSINLLVNNASVFEKGLISETSLELFDRQLSVNLKAPFILMKEFAKLADEGNIINLVDTRVTQNESGYAAYSLSKKGLWELTKMAALEFAPKIRVNAIAPGVTLAPEEKSEEYLLGLAKHTPMKKPSGTQPILKSIDYILGNDHVTGQLLFADGGENLK